MQSRTYQFEFHGKAGEFFKIWIVNLMLSIVTLGIYSAWAKVRTKRYFYSNTLLADTSFDYLADPVKILKGRLLAVVLILIYSFSAAISPMLEGVLLLLFFFLMPWIVIKAFKFNLYNSAYRNLRFHFNAEYSRALMVYIGYPLLIPLTLGLIYPAFVRAQKKFFIDHSAYGGAKFSMSAESKAFYFIYLKIIGISLLTFMLIMLFASLNQSLFAQLGLLDISEYLETEQISPLQVLLSFANILLFACSVIVIFTYAYASIANLVMNNTRLQQCRFESNLETAKLSLLYITNTLAIVFSFGLLIPWAKIRTTRYRLSCLSMISDVELGAFIAGEQENADALGEELEDLLDLDIGL